MFKSNFWKPKSSSNQYSRSGSIQKISKQNKITGAGYSIAGNVDRKRKTSFDGWSRKKSGIRKVR